MKNNALQEQIEAWLNDTMDPETRQAWEKRMAEDPSLRQEVALHQQMQKDFDAGRLQLRANLRNILSEPLLSEVASPSGKRKPWVPGLLLLLVVIGTIWVVWQWGQVPQATIPAAPVSPAPVPTTPDTTLLAPVQEKPIAKLDPARFKPNAGMEALVNSKVRSESISVNMIRPANGVQLTPDEKGRTKLRFSGTILQQTAPGPTEFVLSFFDNVNTSTPILEVPVLVEKTGNNDLKFDFQQGMTLVPGLYYFSLEALDGGEVLYVGKFSIVPR